MVSFKFYVCLIVFVYLCLFQVWVCVMFVVLNIDCGNISNVVLDNMFDDLGLSQVDYVSILYYFYGFVCVI